MPRSSRGESPGQIPTVQDALLSGRDGARPALQPRTRLLHRTLSTPDRPLDIEAEDCLRTDTLGRYPISGRLGAGGMGEVLHVRDDHLGRELAAKVMRSDHAEDPVQLRKFLQEARITGQLEHPNIVPIHELGMTDQKRVFFTMKQIRGRDLAAVLDSAPRPSRIRLLEIFIKICDAISFAHSKGVIHRDLKPANVMVGQFGEVQLMDWGLARQVGQADLAEAGCTLDLGGRGLAERTRWGGAVEPLVTLDGAIVGTPAFMSPEQARGEVSKLDRRADVYALGAILYQILTLELPFEGENLWDVLGQVVEGAVIPPSTRTPQREVPRELEAVALKAMELRPAKRYDTVDLMKQDIEAYLGGRLLQAAEYSAWQLFKKWAVRHKAAVVAAAAILLALIAAFVGIGRQMWQVRIARDAERKQRIRAEFREREARSERRQANKFRKAEAAQRKRAEQAVRQLQAAEWVRKAEELYARKGSRTLVLKLLTDAQRVHPDHSGLLRLRGRLALDQRQWADAKDLLGRALQRDPKDYVTHFLLFRWHAEQGRGNTASAAKHAQAAAEYGTRDSASGLWGLGQQEYDKAHKLSGGERIQALERAVQFCTKALARRADFVWALIVRGVCHKELGSWSKALADHDAVVGLTPEWAIAYNNRGHLHQTMKRYDKALSDYDQAIRLRSRYARAYLNRGRLHQKMTCYDKALADYSAAIRIDPRQARAYVSRGRLHQAMKKYDWALSDYGKAIRLAPDTADFWVRRGNLYGGMQRTDEALSDYGQAMRLAPGSAAAYYHRGNLYGAMKQFARALSDYDQAIRLDPRHAQAHNNRGILYAAMNRPDKALSDYDEAIRLVPRLAMAYVNRGNLHGNRGRFRLAIADWERALPLVRGTAWEQKLTRWIPEAWSRIK